MKILLVDDSRSARYALRLQLQRHGVEVDTADSAETAIETLKGDLPDAILMDHTMPGMNGFEALEVIRADPRTAHIPVVMCTSHEDAEFVATAERKGVAGILPKSVAPEKLPDILAKLQGTPAAAATSPAPQAPPPAATPEAPPTPSAADIAALVDSRLGAQVDARLDQRIETRVTALLTDLRRDLSERLMAEAGELVESRVQARVQEMANEIESRLGAQIRSQESARPVNDETALKSAVDAFARETLPDLVKLEVESERGQIMDLVEQYLREFSPRSNEGERITQQLAASERASVDKALEATRRELGSALAGIRGASQPAEQMMERMRSGLRGVYIGIAAAALVGIGAAVAVYLALT
jgi:CheY-like chemotaxis protein